MKRIKNTAEENNGFSRDDTSVQGEKNREITEKEAEAIVDELALEPKRGRIWEIDAMRGLMILFVIWDHFIFDVRFLKGAGYNTQLFQSLLEFSEVYAKGALRSVTQPVFVLMFVFTSGVSCSFSRSNGMRGVKMAAFAALFTAGTYAVSAIINSGLVINFNVIHVIALSVLLWSLIEYLYGFCKKNWQKNIFGFFMTAVVLTALIVGECMLKKPSADENRLWFFLFEHTGKEFSEFTKGDYLPFLPAFGWFLIGAFLGKLLYKEKKTLFPSVNAKYVAPLTFCGRYSLWFYFGSQVVMFGLIYLTHNILGWL